MIVPRNNSPNPAAATCKLELPSLSADAAMALKSPRPAGTLARRAFVSEMMPSAETLAASKRPRIVALGPRLSCCSRIASQCVADFEGACSGRLVKGAESEGVPWGNAGSRRTSDRACGWDPMTVMFCAEGGSWLGHDVCASGSAMDSSGVVCTAPAREWWSASVAPTKKTARIRIIGASSHRGGCIVFGERVCVPPSSSVSVRLELGGAEATET